MISISSSVSAMGDKKLTIPEPVEDKQQSPKPSPKRSARKNHDRMPSASPTRVTRSQSNTNTVSHGERLHENSTKLHEITPNALDDIEDDLDLLPVSSVPTEPFEPFQLPSTEEKKRQEKQEITEADSESMFAHDGTVRYCTVHCKT